MRDTTKPADENDKVVIKKGQDYWEWSMMQGGRGFKKRSTTQPRRSQLTNSDFLGKMYDIEDDMDFSGAGSDEELRSMREDLAQQIRDVGQEEQDKYDNMPEGLQQGDTGQMIEERAQACESIADELDNVDLDDAPEELEEDELEECRDSLREDLELNEVADIPKDAEGRLQELIDEKLQEKLDEWLDDKRGELESVGFDY